MSGLWDDPSTYPKDSCYFCEHFTSYCSLYEDDYEDEDSGICGKLSDNKHVNWRDSCERFEKKIKENIMDKFIYQITITKLNKDQLDKIKDLLAELGLTMPPAENEIDIKITGHKIANDVLQKDIDRLKTL